eukprot:g7555.t1
MAFDLDDPMPLEGGKSRHAGDTLVEGYVVDHGVVWKKHHSLPSLQAEGLGRGAPADATAALHAQPVRQPPKVSVTLSEYLSAASPNPDPSCDFGWFTPTASASSLLAGDLQDGSYPDPAPPSPSNHPTSFLFANATRVDSGGAKTDSLSPESAVGGVVGIVGGGGGGGGVDAGNDRAQIGAVAESGLSPSVSFLDNGNTSSIHEPSALQPQGQRQDVPPAETRGLARRSGAGGGGGGGGGGSGSDSSCGGGMGVRLLPVSRSRSTTTHLNSWHTLYADASESGKLSSCGRRPSFLISTRNFPERPPTPKAWMRGRRDAGSCRGSGKREGLKRVSPNGLVTGAWRVAPQQQHQADSGGGGRGGGYGSVDACQKQQQQHQQDQQLQLDQQEQSSGMKPKSYSWAITEIRVRKPTRHFPFPAEPPFAEYLIIVCIGRERLVAGWRRASDFEKLAQIACKAWMPKASVAWQSLEQARRMHGGGPCNIPFVIRPRRLDASYLQNKARFLEEFLKQFFFEANSKEALLSFLDTKKPATMEI